MKRNKLIGGVIIAAFIIFIFRFDMLSSVELKSEDRLYSKPSLINGNIAVIGIDEKALDVFGPIGLWERDIMAEAIEILNGGGESKPAVIAVDVLYTNRSANDAADGRLAAAAREGGNVVMAAYVNFEDYIGGSKMLMGFETPYPLLKESVSYGYVNASLDNDSVVRRAMPQTSYGGETLYSFPYQIYKKYTGGDDFGFSSNGELFIDYTGEPGDYGSASFADIFEDNFDPSYYADAIVMIGPYTTGLRDSYYTPMSASKQMHGVEIHANVVAMLLNGDFKKYASFWDNFAVLAAVVLIALILCEFSDIRLLLAAFAVIGAVYLAAALTLFKNGYILMLLYPVFALVLIYLYQLVYGYVTEAFEKQKVKEAFKKYVDPKLAEKLMESGEAHNDEVGAQKDIAVLFADIRGFTPMTESMRDRPDLIVKILNEYLELTSNAVFKNGGSVDKFIGDATMALFNGFVPLDDYVFKAVCAAWDMVQGTAAVNASIKSKYNVDVGFGVGVNCGAAIVGNLGPSFRKDYTAIGDTVNTAARLESNAKRSEVLISSYVYELVKDRITAEPIGEIPLKGKSVKLEVYSVTGINTNTDIP